MQANTLTVGLAQIAPVWLDRERTLDKVVEWVAKAASRGCRLVVFGEALVPGYPFWIERTDGARFESALQKTLYAHYVEQAVCVEDGDLDRLAEAAARHYFRTNASSLSVDQSARLAAMVPNPRYYDRVRTTPALEKKTEIIRSRMHLSAVP